MRVSGQGWSNCFVLGLKGLAETVSGYVFYYYYGIAQANGVMQGEKSIGMGSDRSIKIYT